RLCRAALPAARALRARLALAAGRRLRRRGLALRLDALAQQRHEIDDLRARRLLLRALARGLGDLLRLPRLDLFLDAPEQVLAIRVLVLLGLPGLRHVVDEPQREVDFLGGDLGALEARLRNAELGDRTDLGGVADGVHEPEVAIRNERRQVLAGADHPGRDPDPPGLLQRFPEERIRPRAARARREGVGRLAIGRRDRARGDGRVDVGRLGRFHVGAPESLLREHDVLAGLVLVAL